MPVFALFRVINTVLIVAFKSDCAIVLTANILSVVFILLQFCLLVTVVLMQMLYCVYDLYVCMTCMLGIGNAITSNNVHCVSKKFPPFNSL